MLFSQRNWITKVDEFIQTNGMNDALRNRLLNFYHNGIGNNIVSYLSYTEKENFYYITIDTLFKNIYKRSNYIGYSNYDDFEKDYIFEKNSINYNAYDVYITESYVEAQKQYDWYQEDLLKMQIFFNDQLDKLSWNQIYDFYEHLYIFSTTYWKLDILQIDITKLNRILEEECSGYRFVDWVFAPIIDPIQIQAVQDILDHTDEVMKLPKDHIKRALQLLSLKENPDYANSIKESISAVEWVCKKLNGIDDSRWFAGTLKSLWIAHESLLQWFIKLYGWTSDAEWIRHPLMEESSLGQEDALYMLVICSAFINYLMTKHNKKTP